VGLQGPRFSLFAKTRGRFRALIWEAWFKCPEISDVLGLGLIGLDNRLLLGYVFVAMDGCVTCSLGWDVVLVFGNNNGMNGGHACECDHGWEFYVCEPGT
jgi:hypothetical protein